MSTSTAEGLHGASRQRAVQTSDSLRLLGALTDIVVSVALAVATMLAIDVYSHRLDRLMTLPEAVAIVLLGWMTDIAVYAVPLALLGGSVGNLLTGRRVVDADTNARLSLRRAIRRYFARRNVIRWKTDIDKRTLDLRRAQALSTATRPMQKADQYGPVSSHADRVVHSAVVRRR